MIKNLNKEQTKALKLLLNTKDNLQITGFAGTGKSHVIKMFREIQFALKTQIPIVASTGAAALLVNGITFTSYFGLGILAGGIDATVYNALQKRSVCERIIYTDTIIVDELSMISATYLHAANLLCQKVRQNKKFMGGIRIIFVGDFFQLGPFSESDKVDWIFESTDWKKAKIKVVELKEIMRTKDKPFIEVLSKVRVGKVDKKVESFLNKHVYKGKIKDYDGPIIFSRNNDVDKYNNDKLSQLEGTPFLSKTMIDGENEQAIEKLKESMVIAENIILKKGALVMLRVNNYEDGYINGTMGHVIALSPDILQIKKLNGEIIRVKKHNFDLLNGDGGIIARAKNFPITLSWAITIHKSQGASLEKALIDLDRLWLHGQAYTALSRLTSSKGLSILKWNKKSFIVDKKVLKNSKKK